MRKTLALLFALAVFVPLAACGGDDDSSSSVSLEPSDSESTATTDGDSEASSGDTSGFCSDVEDVANSDINEQLDFENADDLETAAGVIAALGGSAPAELQDDFETVVDFFGIFHDHFEDFTDPDQQEALQAEFGDEIAAFDEATTNIDEFTLSECGITIDGETADSSGSDSGSGDSSGSSDGQDTSLDDFAEDVSACQGGDMATCDVLFGETPSGSEAEAVALDCGGEDPSGGHFGDCESTFG
jgi:hypothetical protein